MRIYNTKDIMNSALDDSTKETILDLYSMFPKSDEVTFTSEEIIGKLHYLAKSDIVDAYETIQEGGFTLEMLDNEVEILSNLRGVIEQVAKRL